MQKFLSLALAGTFALATITNQVAADQATYVTKEQAERAIVLLKDKGEIKHHCPHCDDKSIRPETIKSVVATQVGNGENWEVKVNGSGIDLAYVYFSAATGQWKNVAAELKIEVDTPQFLPVAAPPTATPATPPVAPQSVPTQTPVASVDEWETGGTSPQTSGEFFARGNEFFRQRNYDKAIADFSESIKKREDNATAYLMRGAAHIYRKNYETALADLNKALQLDSWEYLTHFRLGELYEVQGKKELAQQERQKGTARMAQKAPPRTAQEFLERGQYLDERGYWVDAVKYYSGAIKVDANFAPAYEKRAEAYDVLDKLDVSDKLNEAIADYNRFIELQPERVQSYVRRAYLLEDAALLGDGKKDYTPDLLRDYSEIIKRADAFEWNPKPLYEAYTGRAELLYRQKEWDKAISDYTAALKLKPRDSEAFLDRAQAWANKKQYDKAIRDYDYALVLNPKGPGIYKLRGEAYQALKLKDKAIEDFNKATELNPKYVDAFFKRGFLYGDSGEYDKAIDDYTKAIALDAKSDAYFNNRGVAYINKKEWDKAIADLDQAIKLNEKNANAWNNRGVAYRGKEEWDKAIADYTQAIALDANYTQAYTNRAWVYRKQNKNDLAEADEKKAKEIQGKNAPTPATPPPAGNFDDDDEFFF
ncbi:MAG TPA: tetratricopeptide repeat protein [Abditibacteriaceae bacterium]|jgi:tetratricopeptide (TPR) repeat protein